jgi:hypothetical protein
LGLFNLPIDYVNQLFSLRETAMQLRSHVQGNADHPGSQGGGPQKEQSEKMEGRGGGEAQGVADPKKLTY